MANEIQIDLSIKVEKNGAKYERQVNFKDDMAGDAWTTGIVDVTTGGVQLTDLDVGTYGWVFVKNLSTGANFVDIGHTQNTADDYICRLYAGESSIFKTSGLTALWGDADTATQAIEYAIIEL